MNSNPEFTHHYHKDLTPEQKAAEARIVESTYKILADQIDLNKEVQAANSRARAAIISIIVATIVIIALGKWWSMAHAETGTASYYTVASCLREGTSGVTASGERLKDNELTGASWFYPFGTKLLVTNTRNGKSIIITINDRGPSKRLVKKGRIIDLSKLAFSRIAKLTDGVVAVSVEVLK